MAALERLAAVFRPWLAWRSRRGLVRAALDRLPYQPAAAPTLPRVRIGVVQLAIPLASSPQEFVERVHRRAHEAVVAGAGLVIFPEYTSLPLLGLLPGARLLADRLAGQGSTGHAGGDEAERDAYDVIALAFRLVAPAARRVYLATFSGLAARFRVTLLAGSLIELVEGHLCNAGYLFGPDGRLLARQAKTHLVPSEVAMGYAVGEEIRVVETAAGRLAFPICMDHTYFETARIAALQGADLLVDPAANNAYYNRYAQARGIWNRVQEVQTFGVFCGAVGRLAGMVFEGRSGVYAPLGLTPDGSGILAEAQTCDREEVVLAELDYAALWEYRRREPLEFNLRLYERYLPEAYARDEMRGTWRRARPMPAPEPGRGVERLPHV
ncbi:MAG: nitrilase-related carbon-nitrogen hydrolase [Anaerolineae bacterium]|nr:nitrilase-related carbon-nitrogen hydrolase [Anaerolineae bacterium]